MHNKIEATSQSIAYYSKMKLKARPGSQSLELEVRDHKLHALSSRSRPCVSSRTSSLVIALRNSS